MLRLLAGTGAVSTFLAVPLIVLLTVAGAGGKTLACLESSAGGPLAPDAPVPAEARAWIAVTRAQCPDLPEAWIAAVMAQESGFRPDAHADDANGGTWGLFQMNQSIWVGTYGHPWSADVNGNGVWDESDTPIKGAQMGVRIHEGQAFALGDLTHSDGCGFVFVPGGVIEAPVTIRMLPPKGSGLIPIGESEVVYQGGPFPRFLFRKP